jgi:drug/metabolite transporter (DMT)-like permease
MAGLLYVSGELIEASATCKRHLLAENESIREPMESSNQQSRLLPVISLLLSATLWGVVWYPLRLLEQQGLAGLWSALLSFAAATTACLWIFIRERRMLAANFRSLLLMSLAAGWCNVSFIIAVLDGNVVRILLLFYLSPFWAVCLGWLLLGERLDGKSLLVFLVAVSGAFIMLWDDSLGYPWPNGRADWLAVSSGFSFALSNVFVRKLQTVGVMLKSVSTWIAVVTIAAFWIVQRGDAFPDVGHGVVLAAVALGLCGFLVMSLAVVYGVSRMPVHRSAVILLFELVVGAVSSLLLTDEVILVREWLGGGLIVLAAYVAAHIHAVSKTS